MNKCILYQKLLLAYIYDLMDTKEKKEFEGHIRGCAACETKLAELRELHQDLKNEPAAFLSKEKAPNDLVSILAKAKRIENERLTGDNWLVSLLKIFLENRSVKLATAGILAAAVIFVSAVWLAFGDMDYLYMTRAYGDVKVNDKPLFVAKNYIYRMEVSRPVKIGVGLGECEFQVNQNKYFELKPLTRVLVQKSKDIIVDFLEGMLIGKVIKDPRARELQIQIPNQNAIFKVIGTLFYVKSTNRDFEFGVKEGEVRNTISNRTVTIHGSEIMHVGTDYMQLLTNTVEQKQKLDRIFDKIGQYVIRRDFNSTREIVIRTEPSDSEIFWKDKQVGKSPFYVLADREQYKDFTVVKKGYMPRQIEIGNERSYQVVIHPESAPQTIWSLGRKDTRYINPVVLDDGALLIGDESGYLYRLDTVSKKVSWKFKASLRNNSIPLVVGDMVYFSSSDGYLYALKVKEGTLAWKQKVGILVYSGPQFYAGMIYTGNIEGSIFAMDPRDGKVAWKKKFEDGFYTSPLMSENRLFIGAMSGTIYSLDVKNGDIIWQYKTGDRIVSSRPFIREHRLYFGSNDRNFYALDSISGRLIWHYDTGGEIFTSPLIMDDSMVICTVKGDIINLDMEQGEVRWKYATGKKILLNPVLVKGGFVFVSAEKSLYILNRYGILFTQYQFGQEITDFTVSQDKNVFLCGSDGDLKNLRFALD